jgi:fatty acid desaturase
MHLLTLIQTATEVISSQQPGNWTELLLAALVTNETFQLSRKQKRKLKWEFVSQMFKRKLCFKKEKGKGGMLVVLLLLLIACAAVLWILWELGGIFALILGIVFGLGLLTLIFRKD